MRTTTTRKIKARQPAPTSQDPNARKPVPRADEVTSASRSFRERHETAHPGMVLDGLEAGNLRTLSMGRKPRGDGDGRPPLPDGGAGFTGNAATD